MALWGTKEQHHTAVVYSIMVQAPATYRIAGHIIHLDEGSEILFPQHMAHEVYPKGEQSVRRNTTHRVWILTAMIEKAVPNNVVSAVKVQQELNWTSWWKFWRLSPTDWIAGKQNKQLQMQKDHFALATRELIREKVREGRTIWQCGAHFDYKTSTVTQGKAPTDRVF